jgi:hypothetical protein
MKMLKMCLNRKVLAGLAAVGVGIYFVTPDLVLAALPILLLAACPLSMLLMMWAMRGGPSEDQQASQEADAGLMREEHLTRLRWQQAALADRIDELEQDEPQPARDGKRR